MQITGLCKVEYKDYQAKRKANFHFAGSTATSNSSPVSQNAGERYLKSDIKNCL